MWSGWNIYASAVRFCTPESGLCFCVARVLKPWQEGFRAFWCETSVQDTGVNCDHTLNRCSACGQKMFPKVSHFLFKKSTTYAPKLVCKVRLWSLFWECKALLSLCLYCCHWIHMYTWMSFAESLSFLACYGDLKLDKRIDLIEPGDIETCVDSREIRAYYALDKLYLIIPKDGWNSEYRKQFDKRQLDLLGHYHGIFIR